MFQQQQQPMEQPTAPAPQALPTREKQLLFLIAGLQQ